jgi:hypothetical protein
MPANEHVRASRECVVTVEQDTVTTATLAGAT